MKWSGARHLYLVDNLSFLLISYTTFNDNHTIFIEHQMNVLNKQLFFQHQIQEFISLFKYLSSLEMCGCLEECVEEEKHR